MNIHRLYANVSPFFRRRRMRLFRNTVGLRSNDRILDIGGTPSFWQDTARAGDAQPRVTLVNTDRGVVESAKSCGMSVAEADGCALPFADNSFDIVFSNSVIEHVGTWERQQAFASEARRIGRRLWIQTPAREVFVEPHLIAPFVHWLRPSLQRRLIRNLTLRGWLERPDRATVDAFLAEVRLLTAAEMRTLFPDCSIVRERFCGLTKSYIAARS